MLSKIKTQYLLHLVILLLAIFVLINHERTILGSIGRVSSSSVATAERIKDLCSGKLEVYGSKENCYAQAFNKIGENFGHEVGFEVLENLQKIDKDAAGCHLLAHGLGAGLFKRNPNNWNTLVQNIPTICNYGAIHGVLESYIGSLPDKSMTSELTLSICGDTPRADCNHIVGHLLLVEAEADINKALDKCNVFKDEQQNYFCISGVFMEYQTALNLIEHKLVPQSWQNWTQRLPELEEICRTQKESRVVACWEEIVHAAAVKFSNDPKQVFDFCSSSQSLDGAKKCRVHSIGIMGASRNFDLDVLKSMCLLPQKNDPSFENDCYPALVSSALSTTPKALTDAVKMCRSIKEVFKPDCFSMIGIMSHSGILTRGDLDKACLLVPSQLKMYCVGDSSSLIRGNVRSND